MINRKAVLAAAMAGLISAGISLQATDALAAEGLTNASQTAKPSKKKKGQRKGKGKKAHKKNQAAKSGGDKNSCGGKNGCGGHMDESQQPAEGAPAEADSENL